MKKLLILLLIISSGKIFSQQDSIQIDKKYLEDQLYIKVSYNTLGSQPSNVSSSGFSYGLSAGFIKDIPLNKKRNIALGLGLGYGYDSFNHDLKVSENLFEINENLTSNKMTFHNIEFPIEFRWRNSTPTKYDFWRIYTGLQISYNFSNHFTYSTSENDFSYSNISSYNNWQTGLTFSGGYGAFNVYFYYGLTPIFKDATIDAESIDTKVIKFGLVFYIL